MRIAILSCTLLLFCNLIYSQSITFAPEVGSRFYSSLDLSLHLGSRVKMPNAATLLQETFCERYAPKSITSLEAILKRAASYSLNPNMRSQDLGWLFETYVKNKYTAFNYVKSSTAPMNDLTGRLANGKIINAQLKVHKSGNPRLYFKDMLKGYNSTFIIPDDHVRSLKTLIKKYISERDYLKRLPNRTSAQTSRLNFLADAKLETKLNRIKGGGITYANLSRRMDAGIRQIAQKVGASPVMRRLPSQMLLRGLKIGGVAASQVIGKSGPFIVWGGLYAYEAYSIYSKYSAGKISKRDFYKGEGKLAAGMVGAIVGFKVGASMAASVGFSDLGASIVVGSLCGAIGYFVCDYFAGKGFDAYYSRLDEKSKQEYEAYVSSFYLHNKLYVL